MNKKKLMIWSLITVAIVILLALIVITIMTPARLNRSVKEEDPSAVYGEISTTDATEILDVEQYDQERHDDSDIWDNSWEEGEIVPDDGVNCYYKNMECVFNYIPIGVVATLREETSEFLIQNGYEDDTSIEIIENTIEGNRENVNFSCVMEKYPDETLVVSYDSRKGIVEFKIQ